MPGEGERHLGKGIKNLKPESTTSKSPLRAEMDATAFKNI